VTDTSIPRSTPGDMHVPIRPRAWWRLAGIADEAGITVGDLLEEFGLDGKALAAAQRRSERDRNAAQQVLTAIAERYRNPTVADEDFLAWIESVLPA
jgi:hypothetical protein